MTTTTTATTFAALPLSAAFTFRPSADGLYRDSNTYCKVGQRTYHRVDAAGALVEPRYKVGTIKAAVEAQGVKVTAPTPQNPRAELAALAGTAIDMAAPVSPLADYSGIDVSNMADDGAGVCRAQERPDLPGFWSVYLHNQVVEGEGGHSVAEWQADFHDRPAALAFAQALGAEALAARAAAKRCTARLLAGIAALAHSECHPRA